MQPLLIRSDNELRRGVHAMLPLLAAVAPVGLVLGAAVAAHRSPAAGWAGTWLIYSGSAHLAVMQTLDRGGGVALAVVAGLLVNLRLIVYSAATARHWRHESTAFKAAIAATIVDPVFAVTEPRFRRPGNAREHREFYVGAALTLWFGWMVVVTTGMLVGATVGPISGLELAVPLCLVALLAPALRGKPGRATAAAASAVAAAGAHWPPGTGLLAAILAGAVAGVVAERRTR